MTTNWSQYTSTGDKEIFRQAAMCLSGSALVTSIALRPLMTYTTNPELQREPPLKSANADNSNALDPPKMSKRQLQLHGLDQKLLNTSSRREPDRRRVRTIHTTAVYRFQGSSGDTMRNGSSADTCAEAVQKDNNNTAPLGFR